MSVSAIKSHPLGTTVSQILTARNEKAFSNPSANFNDDQKWMIDRIFAVTNRTQQLLNDTPAILISLAGISNLNSHFSSLLNEVQAFVNNGNIGHIQNASSIIDSSILPSMWAFSPTRDRAGQALGKTFSDISARASAAVESLAARSNATAEQLAFISSEIESFKARMSQLTEESESNRRINADALVEIKTSYAELERSLKQKFDEAQSIFGDSFEDNLNTAKEKFDLQNSINAEAFKKAFEDISQHEKEARRIVQIVGNIGVTGNYQNIANEENKQAEFWRWMTVAFFSLGVLAATTSFVIFIIHEFSDQPATDSIWTFVARFVTAVAIAAPAFYTARESARHRTNSDRARQKELELASLGPFMDSLPDAVKIELKQKLTERYFGNGIEPHEIKQPVDLDSVIKIIQSVTGAAK